VIAEDRHPYLMLRQSMPGASACARRRPTLFREAIDHFLTPILRNPVLAMEDGVHQTLTNLSVSPP
jgi:hypothetical protein